MEDTLVVVSLGFPARVGGFYVRQHASNGDDVFSLEGGIVEEVGPENTIAIRKPYNSVSQMLHLKP